MLYAVQCYNRLLIFVQQAIDMAPLSVRYVHTQCWFCPVQIIVFSARMRKDLIRVNMRESSGSLDATNADCRKKGSDPGKYHGTLRLSGCHERRLS